MPLALLAFGLAPLAPAAAHAQGRPVEPRDIVTRTDIIDVQLSPDGAELLFVTRTARPAEDRFEQEVRRMAAVPGAPSRVLAEGAGERSPRWAPDGAGFAWISDREGSAQVWGADPDGGTPRRLTSSPTNVREFAWSPDGDRIAFTALGELPAFERSGTDDRLTGAIIDKMTFVNYRLFGNALMTDQQRRTQLYVTDLRDGGTRRVSGRHSVEEFAWSPDGAAIAFTGKAGPGYGNLRADLFLYRIGAAEPRLLLEGRDGRDGPHDFTGALTYYQPMWSPDGKRLGLVRSDRTDRWSAPFEIGIHDLASGKTRFLDIPAQPDFYIPRFRWPREDHIVVEDRWKGRNGLLAIHVDSVTFVPLVHSDRYAELFSFSADGEHAAWVWESLSRPPEVHVAPWPYSDPTRVTALNRYLDAVALPEAEPIRWRSDDGVPVEGWLVRPVGDHGPGPHPLLVLVHGGPVFSLSNPFMGYPHWPYPVHTFAARGYAVLMPNYRGTGSYGKRFREPSDQLAEPIADIMAGIRHVAAEGIADPDRIGIMGQSHGGWLAPMTLIRHPVFRAASFAEGLSNFISLYGHGPAWVNTNIHEHYFGADPYRDPQRYIELSPIFHLEGTSTPTLLELGQESLAIQGMEYASALWHHGIPYEFVIYPRTGHNIASAALLLEVMERNLDWFDFWMLGRKDPAPEKQGQYRRWEEMGDRARTSATGPTPSGDGRLRP